MHSMHHDQYTIVTGMICKFASRVVRDQSSMTWFDKGVVTILQ